MNFSNIQKTPLLIAAAFALIALVPFIPSQVQAQSTDAAKTLCEKRVKLLNNRGKKMAKQSKSLQDRYKKVSAGWKAKTKTNRDLASKYKKEPQLATQVQNLEGKINDFQAGVKAYNSAKRTYIAERNSQIKSYKSFKPNCATSAGRVSAQTKMRQYNNNDRKELAAKSQAVMDTYKKSVRPTILTMREARNGLITARKALDAKPVIASSDEIDADVTDDDIYLDEGADDEFDISEFDDPSNIEL